MSAPIDFDESLSGLNQPDEIKDSSKVSLAEREDAEAIKKTQEIARRRISPEIPHPNDRLDPERVIKGPPIRISPLNDPRFDKLSPEDQDKIRTLLEQNERLEGAIQDMQTQAESFPKPKHILVDFPHFAWEAIQAGLAKERVSHALLDEHVAEAKKIQKSMDLLLELNGSLAPLKEGGELPEKTKTLLAELKAVGIDLWQAEHTNLTEKEVEGIKQLASSQMDKLRTDLQIIFTTKIQVETNAIASIMEILKTIINNNNSLVRKTLELPR
jgi:hypothetical protein